jgi:xanthine dehydrogenase YagS FAD-binding subunit
LLRPATVDEALALMTALGRDARLLAGGQDLLYRYKKRLATNPGYLVDLKRIGSLQGIQAADSGLRIGALTTLGELERSAEVRAQFPMLVAAASEIASPQIRNLGTVGGNLCQDVWCWYLLADYDCWLNGGRYCYAAVGDHRYYHSIAGGRHCIAVHPSDLAPALIALDATAALVGPEGRRAIPIDQLWPGFVEVAGRLQPHNLRPEEILEAVEVPAAGLERRNVFLKFRLRRAWDFALASVAVSLALDDGLCSSARVVLGGISTRPRRALDVEAALVGRQLTTASIASASALAPVGTRPLRDNRYKVPLLVGLTRKALAAALLVRSGATGPIGPRGST